MQVASSVLCTVSAVCTMLLLAVGQAHADCNVMEKGVLMGLLGVHLETLRPGQRFFQLTIPPVCVEQNGMRAVACETAVVVNNDVDVDIADDNGNAPLLELNGRQITVTRNVDAVGFAMLSVELYCA